MPPRPIACLAFAAVLSVAPFIARDAAGQNAPGTWFELGLAPGWSSLACQVCVDSWDRGVDVRLAVGRMARPSFRWGVEVGGWTARDGDVREIVGAVNVVGHVRPATGPLVLKLGAGTGHYRALDPGDGDDVRYLGANFQLGLGAEIRVGDRSVVTPGVAVSSTGFGRLTRGDDTLWRNAGVHLVRTGLTITRIPSPAARRVP